MSFAALIGPLGLPETLVVLLVGLLLFGRRLPEVGLKAGRGIAHLRRQLQGFRDELDKDSDFREAREAFDQVRSEVSQTRNLTDPRRLIREAERAVEPEKVQLRELADDLRATPPVDATRPEPNGTDDVSSTGT